MNDLEFEILIKILLNLVNPYAIYMLYGAILKEKKINNKITFCSYALFYFLTTFIYLFVNIPLFVILSNLLGFLLLTFIYKENLIKKIFAFLASYSFLFIIETFVFLLLGNSNLELMKSITVDSIGLVFISKTLIFLFSNIIFLFYKNDKVDFIPQKYYILLILISMITAFTVFITTIFFSKMSFLSATISILSLLVNLIFFLIYYDLTSLFEREYHNSQVERQYELIKFQSDNINASSEKLRQFEHDLKNKLTPIYFMAKEENFEELNSHIQSIIGEFSIMEIFKDSGVLELDSILNVKFSEGEKIGIDFQKKITKISNEIVNGLDLAVIVGNLLDNAIEATSKVSSKWIDIKIKEVYEVVYISIENSFDGVLKEKDGRLLTRKSNERRHGMGLRNVQTIIKKYDGDMKITYTPATFKVSIILYKTQNSQYFG